MTDREARYYAAVALAQEILAGPQEDDGKQLAEAIAVVTAEVLAGRRNQEEFPELAAEVLERLSNVQPPALRLVVDP